MGGAAVGPLAARGAWYLDAGFTVVPLEPNGHKAIGEPTRSHGTLAGYLVAEPAANIGLALPPGSIAITVEAGAAQQLAGHMRAGGHHLPETKCLHTARRGIQAIFRCPTPPKYTTCNGIHITTAPHYIVAAPSTHPNGNTIVWGNYEARIAPAPAWLLEYLNTPAEHPTGTAPAEAKPPTMAEAVATFLEVFPGATVVAPDAI